MRDKVFWIALTVLLSVLFGLLFFFCFMLVKAIAVDVESGELLDSYALEDGGAIIVTYQPADNNPQLVVAYINSAGERDCLRRENLPGELGDIMTEVCGGRLHLTYSVDDEVLHQTVDIPNADLGFLPLVCREAQ